MPINDVYKRISKLKHNNKYVLTNCFENLNSPVASLWSSYCSDKTILFVNPEYKVNRLLFYTADIHDMRENVFSQLPAGEYCMDIITKVPERLQNEFETIDIILKARMIRLSSSDISVALDKDSGIMRYYNHSIGNFPEISDAPQILELLWKTFDTDISHLPDLSSVKDSIQKREITWFRGEGGRLSLLQAVIKPKSFYINQIINENDKGVIHAMLLNRLSEYCLSGGKYAYSWVDENNIASQKFHAKYQMEHDGLWNLVFKVKLI